jgi:hypothetical protein
MLHPLTKNQGCIPRNRDPLLALILPVIVHEDNVKGVEVPWDISIYHLASVFLPESEKNENESVVVSYPRKVRMMLIRISAPQPATMNTPTGGTNDDSGQYADETQNFGGEGHGRKIVIMIRQMRPRRPMLWLAVGAER